MVTDYGDVSEKTNGQIGYRCDRTVELSPEVKKKKNLFNFYDSECNKGLTDESIRDDEDPIKMRSVQ